MENWINKTLVLGNIREGKTLKLSFVATPYIKDISLIVPGCGCFNCEYDIKKRILNVTYKVGFVPNHITDNQEINKSITVLYKDGTQDELYINAIKTKE